ncbi:MAG: TonB-dependent receptor [Gammaproteobacteria bacterium]|nr:TonB-dependent receptor [Gammaproteobacteria bacterium]
MLTASVTSLRAQEENADDLYLSFGDEDFVSIATGQKKPISKAPAVASVITQDDMKAMGITSLEEALEMVPGVHVSVSSAYNPIYVFRGIYNEFNPQVLVLINSIPITNVFVGDRSQVWRRMSVEAIDRIEVIRGPGSAVYGADAFAGVVNIITKANPNSSSEAGIRAGSFDRRGAWTSIGGNLGKLEAVLTFEYEESDGHERIIESDLQSVFDLPPPAGFGTSASLAPGSVNLHYKNIDFRLDLSYDDWRFRMGYQGRKDLQAGAGVAQALDGNGVFESDRYNADITYDNKEISDNWELVFQLSWFDTTQETDLYLFPAGAILPIGQDGNIGSAPLGGFVMFPDGVRGQPNVYEQHLRFSTDAFYSGFDNHTFRIGTGVSHANLQARESKNYGPGVIDGTEGIVDGGLINVTDTEYAFMDDQKRDVTYLFVQDEWNVAPDWVATVGLRYDDYSDFGDTVNPRFALVWQAAYNLTAKLLYGSAFRAPSFAEQYNRNNPVSNGNRDLDPEQIETTEIVIDYTSQSGKVHTIFNVFDYKMRDIIRFLPDPNLATTITAQNFGEQSGHGFEWELKWSATDQLSLYTNYAYQKSEDSLTSDDVAYAPGRQAYLKFQYDFLNAIDIGMQINAVMDRKREISDPRSAIDDYTTVDLTLRYKMNRPGSEFAVSVRNAMDKDVREPSRAPGVIPYDLPQAGRSAFAEYRYSW